MYAVSAEDQELYNKGGIQLFIQTVWGKLEKWNCLSLYRQGPKFIRTERRETII